MGVRVDCIRLTGGGAKNRLFAQIRADLTRRPVEYGAADHAAPLGAAALAAVAAGWFADPSESAAALLRDYRRLDPEPAQAAAYDAAHARYRQLFEALQPMFDDPASVAPDGISA
jgi:xylulokinase